MDTKHTQVDLDNAVARLETHKLIIEALSEHKDATLKNLASNILRLINQDPTNCKTQWEETYNKLTTRTAAYVGKYNAKGEGQAKWYKYMYIALTDASFYHKLKEVLTEESND